MLILREALSQARTFFLCGTCLVSPIAAYADGKGAGREMVYRLGVIALEEVLVSDPKAPKYTPQQLEEASIQAISSYQDLQEKYNLTKEGLQDLDDISDLVIVGSIVSGSPYAAGVGTVMGLATKGMIIKGEQALDDFAKRTSKEYLEGLWGAIQNELSPEDRDLNKLARDPEGQEKIAEILASNERFLASMRENTADDLGQALATTAAQSVAHAAFTEAQRGVQFAVNTAQDLDALERKFEAHRAKSKLLQDSQETYLARHDAAISDLQVGLDTLGTSVEKMSKRVDEIGSNQDLLLDFAYNRMTAAERAKALASGRLDRMVTCPSDTPNCDRDAVRGAMIERFRNEAQVDKLVTQIGSGIRDAQTAITIASDLGLDLPKEVVDVVDVAGRVFNAATMWSSNPLGAIQQITGFFGSKSDAAAERHKQMMDYLAKNFEHINTQLREIQKNQQTILDSIVDVSLQIVAMHKDMDARFAALEYQIDAIDNNVQKLLWAEWRSCSTPVDLARQRRLMPEGAAPLLDDDLAFLGLDRRKTFTDLVKSDVDSCIKVFQNLAASMTSSNNWTTFGSPLDLEASILDLDSEQIDRIDYAIGLDRQDAIQRGQEPSPDYRKSAQLHFELYSQPSGQILRAWAARKNIDEATLLGILVSAPSDASEVEGIRKLLGLIGEGNTGWRFDCNSDFPDGFSGASIQRVLCYRDATDHSVLRVDMPSLYLTRALNTARLADILPWGFVMAQAADIYPLENGAVAGTIEELAAMPNSGRGEAIIHTMVDLSTVSVAYEQRLYGGILALAIVDDIVDGVPLTENHRLSLQSNPYLADNVAVLLLRRWTGREDIANWGEPIPFFDAYLTSILHSRDKAAVDRLDLLVPLLGEFEYAQLVVAPLKEELISIQRPLDEEVPSWTRFDNKAAIRLETTAGPAFIPMPAPYQLIEGRLVMPPAYDRLVNVRRRLVDREMSYAMGREDYIDVLLASFQRP